MGLTVPEQATYTGNKTITGSLTVGGQIIAIDGTDTLPGIRFGNAGTGFSGAGGNRIRVDVGSPLALAEFNGNDHSIRMISDTAFGWVSSGSEPGGTHDLKLFRDAAGVLAQRNGTNAQQFNIYNTYTDASNYERGEIIWTSNTLLIRSLSAGSGAARGVNLRSASNLTLGAVGSDRWIVTDTALIAGNNYNIWNGTSALATTATLGFLGVNSCAGTPTGVPSNIPTGQIPIVYDSTNDKLYIYRSGWKAIPAVSYS